ncbi:hypothetical protein LTR85_002549 [Meristemomyces frigidus]|nr:hypothetical protein LTR85_002549 [Meristemomyces frigidus]
MDEWGDWQDVLNRADVDTARLIVQLQLEDIGAVVPDIPPRARGPQPDDLVAGRVYKNELKRCEADVSSRKLGEELEDDDNSFEGSMEAAAFGWKYDEYKNTIERVPEPVKLIACTGCADDHHADNISQMPCSHYYCRDCLENLYTSSMTDETLFPPRCCHQEFPYDLVKRLLTQRCRSKFGQKRIELETKDRTYCYIATCSAFIKPDNYVGSGALCPQPEHGWTCIKCKNAYHLGECPRDETMDVLMATAEEQQWQRCFGCRRVVELKLGCNHITCVCKSEFCYVCGKPWKTCNCLQWDEARLFERAAAIVDNGHVPPAGYQLQGREQQVAAAAEHLREHHECDHERFRGIREQGREYQCETCNETYRTWIYQCRQCWITICNRCRHNRL